jgi:hypothetical protein
VREDQVGDIVGRAGDDDADGPDAAVHVGGADGDGGVAANVADQAGEGGRDAAESA